MHGKHRIICVDDDRNVLEGFRLHLRKDYEVSVADSGKGGLELLEQFPETAVIVSDMRMPEMDGASFLAKVKDIAPGSVRVLLTGYSDFEAAVRAVNEGEIFRFASKPCPPPDLKSLLEGCIEQFELQQMEKTLLNQTLVGSISATLDLLDGVAPGTRARISRIRERLTSIARRAGLKQRWQLQLAAAFSQFPQAALAAGRTEGVFGGALGEDEEHKKQLDDVTVRFAAAVAEIPRLQEVGAMLRGLADEGAQPDKRSRLLGAAIQEDALSELGYSPGDALVELRKNWGEDVSVYFESARGPARASKIVDVNKLLVGMTLAEDLRLADGALIGLAGTKLDSDDIKNLHEMVEGEQQSIRVV